MWYWASFYKASACTSGWWTSAGATVPLLGFGYSLAKGVAKGVAEKGLLGAFTGGVSGAAGGIAAAIVFGCLFALLSRPADKSGN